MPDVFANITLHTWPSVQPVHSLLGLADTEMTTVRAVMQLIQAQLSEVLTVRNNHSLIVPPET